MQAFATEGVTLSGVPKGMRTAHRRIFGEAHRQPVGVSAEGASGHAANLSGKRTKIICATCFFCAFPFAFVQTPSGLRFLFFCEFFAKDNETYFGGNINEIFGKHHLGE